LKKTGVIRAWLDKHSTSSDGVWLLFGKKGGPVTLTAGEALEEALCFGWIDGQMKSIDDKTYKKYFSIRRANSKWSDKNKALAEQLEQQGKMNDFGRAKIEEARNNGQWNAAKYPAVTTRAYLDAKTDGGREKRFAWMIERLNKNLKPM